MITLDFLEVADPLTNYGIKAGFKHNGKRYISLVTSQNGVYFVTTGAKATHDFTRHELSSDQTAAVEAFKNSSDYAVEFFGNPVR